MRRSWREKLSGGEGSNLMGYWRDSIGSHLDPQLTARSPLRAAAQVRAPLLLIYSADDSLVSHSQSQDMAKALHDNGKDTKLSS